MPRTKQVKPKTPPKTSPKTSPKKVTKKREAIGSNHIKRLAVAAGADRVSDKAVAKIRSVVKTLIKLLVMRAELHRRHSKRLTLKVSDLVAGIASMGHKLYPVN